MIGKETMHPLGVIHGRFQVLHNDHVAYLLAGRARCRHLVVGITNPDPSLTRSDAADTHRSLPGVNPLTYFERYVMVRDALQEAGTALADFSVVPFPVNVPELYRHYVPLDAVFFLTIYDDWGRRKLELFRSLGLQTEILWERPREQKGLSAGEIRSFMVDGKPWKHLVPPSTARLMERWDISRRLRELGQAG